MKVDVQDKVKAVVQVAGLNSLVRIDPKDDEKGEWFRAVCPVPSFYSLFLTPYPRSL